MLVIPAIDIIGGRCACLSQGKFDKKTVYNVNPVEVAKGFEKKGARALHIVDLDGAKSGFPVNSEIVFAIARVVNIPIQVGGGIRSYDQAKRYLENGIERIILGTALLKNPKLLERLLEDFGTSRLLVSLDIKDEKLLIEGWTKEGNKSFRQIIPFLKKMRIKNVIVTDTSKDGLLKGANFELVERFISKGFEIIVAGGVSSLSEIQGFNKLGVYGVIVGKAIYENRISLKDLKSMIEKKIIPCLDCKIWKGKWSVVKGIKFEKLRFAGDPVKLAKKYSKEGADELTMLDISASQERRRPFFDLVKKVAKVIKPHTRAISVRGKIPLIVGGGINTLSDIEKLLKAGATKVSLNTAIVKNPDFLNQAVKKFGSQRIIAAIDTKKQGKICHI